MAGKIKGLTVVIDGDTTKLSTAMRTAKKESNSLKSELKGVTSLLKFNPASTVLIAQKQGLYTAAIAQTQQKMDMLRSAEQRYHAQIGPHTQAEEREYRNLQREIAATEQRYRELRRDSIEFGTAASAQTLAAQAKMSGYGTALEAAGQKMMALTAGVAYIGYKGVKSSMEFDSAMSQVAATMGMSADEVNEGSESFEKLTGIAREMGATTKFTATEAAEGLNYLALAGYDANASVAALPTVLNLAAAGNMDLATASDLVTDALSALGFSSEELAKDQSILTGYADEMAKTASSSNTSVKQLGEATLISAGTARTYGISLEEINTALGVLANNGLKSAEGGTALRNAILNLYNASSAAQPMLDKLGVSTKDSQGNLRSLEDVLTDLNKSLSGMTQADKAKAIATIFDKRVIAPAVALLNSTGSEVMSLSDALKAAGIDAKDYGTSIEELQKKYKEVGEGADFSATLMSEFKMSQKDAKAVSDAVALSLGDSSTAFSDLKAKVEDAGGACQDMADTQLNNLEGSVTLLESAVDGALQTIGGELSPTVREVATAITEAVTSFNNLDDSQKQAIVRTALLVAAAGPLVLIAGKTASGVGKLIAAYASAKTTLDLWSQGLTKNALAQEAAGAAMDKTSKRAKAQSIALKGAAAAAKVMSAALAALVAVEVISWIDGSSSRLDEAKRKFDSAASSIKSFGQMVSESKSQVSDMSATLTASGSTVGKLSAVIEQKEQAITDIISKALSEQRSLRDEDVKSIKGYNKQVEKLEGEKVKSYESGMKGVADSAKAEKKVSAKRAAELIATANDYYNSGLEDLDKYHNSRLTSLNNQYSVEGGLTKKQYEKAIAEENAYYDKTRKGLEKQLDSTTRAVSEKSSDSVSGFSKKQKSALDDVSALSEELNHTLSTNIMGTTVYFGKSTSEMSDYQARMAEALSKVADSTNAAFLGMQLTVAASGGQITEDNAEMVDQLLSTFENLPPGMEEYGDAAMQSLAAGLDDQLGIDVANSTAAQIAEAFRSKMADAGLAGKDMGDSMASGLEQSTGDAQSAGEQVSGQAEEGLSQASGSSLGSFLANAYVSALLGATGNAYMAGQQFSQSASSGAKSVDGSGAGRNFATGFLGKLAAFAGSAFSAGFNFVKNALTGANKAQDSHSPSKETAKSAGWFAQGFLNTLKGYEEDAYQAGHAFVSASVRGANSAPQPKLATALAASDAWDAADRRAAKAGAYVDASAQDLPAYLLKPKGSLQDASSSGGTGAGGAANFYINGAVVNQDKEMQRQFVSLMSELRRKGGM